MFLLQKKKKFFARAHRVVTTIRLRENGKNALLLPEPESQPCDAPDVRPFNSVTLHFATHAINHRPD